MLENSEYAGKTKIKMRGYECFYCHKVDDKLVANANTSCWAGVSKYLKNYYNNDIQIPLKENIIYIKNYEEPETIVYQELIVNTINEITPCSFVLINGTKYIQFNLLETYDQCLILLNFIRNLWHTPKSTYSIDFFKELCNMDDEDAMVRLTSANKIVCKTLLTYGHSNTAKGETLKVKTIKQLISFKGSSTSEFLTT